MALKKYLPQITVLISKSAKGILRALRRKYRSGGIIGLIEEGGGVLLG